jgi:predicted unusual protein kinase regulating ubiquinone biosynthesis (AarF/ABC1/UbiB family)
VPPFESETAVRIIETELGQPVDVIFDRFDRDPIAAASLGQVHRATLRGEEVVIKVQRPGLKALFDIDLKNLRVRLFSDLFSLPHLWFLCVYRLT